MTTCRSRATELPKHKALGDWSYKVHRPRRITVSRNHAQVHHFSLDLRTSKTTMHLSTSDRKALWDHLTSEFHRWVEDLLSRDELPLVGSAVPAMKHPQPRCGNRRQGKTKNSKKTMTKKKTSPEEDKTTAPVAPAPEDQRPAPAASTPDEASREDGWKTARSSKRRRRSLDTRQTSTKPGKRPRAPATPPSSTKGKQCHNCQGYGYPTCTCKRQPICAQCSGTHRSTVCVDQRTEGVLPQYYCDLCMEEGHGRRSWFCRNRPQPAPKPKPTPPTVPADEVEDTTPPASPPPSSLPARPPRLPPTPAARAISPPLAS